MRFLWAEGSRSYIFISWCLLSLDLKVSLFHLKLPPPLSLFVKRLIVYTYMISDSTFLLALQRYTAKPRT